MSRYSDYEKKIAPLVKAKNFIKRHRVLLIAIASSCACAAIALTSTKGLVTDQVLASDHITYGELLSYSSSAFMGQATYEFSPADKEEWSSLVPTACGDYKMRAKAGNSFGGSYYGDVHYFTIDPYATTCALASDKVSYGVKPGVSIDLVNGDKVGDYEIVYDDLSKDNPTASIQNVKIVNGEGGDVTSNYSITCASAEVSFSKRSISLSFSDCTFGYDGLAHTIPSDEYTLLGELAEGDELQFELNSITDVGRVSALTENSVKIIHDDATDVTKHYDITIKSAGSLSVEEAQVSLRSVSKAKAYDGQPFSEEEYSVLDVKEGFYGLDDVSPTFEDQSANVAPGTYKNKFAWDFVPSDASSNYKVTPTYGDLVINKRPISVKVEGTHVYEGTNFAGILPSSEVSVTSDTQLVTGQKLTCYVENESDCLNNAPEILFKITDEEGKKDFTDFYVISLDPNSALRYEPKEATVTAEDVSFTYDGEAHKGTYTYDGFLNGDYPVFSSKVPEHTELGTEGGAALVEEYAPVISKILSADGNIDRTKYYDVTCLSGTFTLLPRPLEVALHVERDYATYGAGISGVLDGAEYSLENETSLVEGQTLTITPSNIYSSERDFATKIYSGGKDVTGNYSIQLDASDVLYTKSQILLSNYQDITLDYDGEYHYFDVSVSGLRDGDYITWDTSSPYVSPRTYKALRAGTYAPQFKIKSIKNSSGKDVTEHYLFEESYSASMEIKKAGSALASLTVNRDYDGNYSGGMPILTSSDYEFKNLKDADSGSISLNEDPFLNIKTENFSVSIINSNLNADVSDCYEKIEKLNESTSTWEKQPLKVEATIADVVYDGQYRTASVTVSGLAQYDSVTYTCNGTKNTAIQDGSSKAGSFSKIGTYDLEIKIISVQHKGGGDASSYYSSLEEVDGKITISARPLKLHINTHGSSPSFTCLDGTSLALGDSVGFTYAANGDDRVDYIPHVYNSSNVEVTSNYSITYDDGGYTLDRIPMTVTCKDETIVYDGTSHRPSSFDVTGVPSGCSVKTSSVSINVPSSTKATYAGDSVTYTPVVTSIKDANGTDETSLFKVTAVPGTLSITKREIHISINGSMTYNGSLFSSRTLTEWNDYFITDYASDAGLASTDNLTITPKDDGKGSIIGQADASDFDVVIKCGNEDRTKNYDITLSVDYSFYKGDVSIYASNNSYTYNGEARTGGAKAYAAGNDKAKMSNDCEEQTEAGSYTYTISVSEVTSSSGEDRSAYYNLPTQEDFELTIWKASATIVFSTYSAVENGSPLDLNAKFSEFEDRISTRSLPEGYEVTDYVFEEGPTEPGTYKFKDYLKSYKIVNKDGEDKTSNFSMTIQGNFVIKERYDVQVTLKNISKVYNGTSRFGANDLSWTISGNPTGSRLQWVSTAANKSDFIPDATDVGAYQAKQEVLTSYFRLVDSSGNPYEESAYTIKITNKPTFTITKCKITFATESIVDYYDGETLTIDDIGASIIETNSTVTKMKGSSNKFKCGNDTITLNPRSFTFDGPTEGEIPNGTDSEPWTYTITRNGVDVSDNYEISIVYGTITIYNWN